MCACSNPGCTADSERDADGSGARAPSAGQVSSAADPAPHRAAAPEPSAPPEPGPPPAEPPPRLYARKYVSRVWSRPSVESEQLGYMRAGAVVTAKTAESVGNERCYRGWYEIAETGGFVCDGREVTAFRGDELPDVQPAQPNREAALPYRYAFSKRSDTPMYKRLPTRAEVLRIERGLAPDGTPLQGPGEPADAGADAGDAGDAGDAHNPSPEAPTLEDLRGERGALVRRILQAGFYISLDRELERDGRRYWRTLSSGHVPAARLEDVTGSDFQGVPLTTQAAAPTPPAQDDPGQEEGEPEGASAADAEADGADEPDVETDEQLHPAHAPPLHLPIGYVISSKTPRYTRVGPRRVLRRAEPPGYHHAFEIVAEEKARGRTYLRDAEGYLYRASQVRRIDRVQPPDEVGEDEHWIDIDLGNQSLVAYEGDEPVYATLISSGRVRGRPGSPRYHATPTGTYRILSKHVSTTMDGDHAIFGPYSLEDVPYVQFFQGALALHSAFWHNRFGRASSHGCINLAPRDALWLFDWTRPGVPAAWHAAYPRQPEQGSLLRIHGETPPG